VQLFLTQVARHALLSFSSLLGRERFGRRGCCVAGVGKKCLRRLAAKWKTKEEGK